MGFLRRTPKPSESPRVTLPTSDGHDGYSRLLQGWHAAGMAIVVHGQQDVSELACAVSVVAPRLRGRAVSIGMFEVEFVNLDFYCAFLLGPKGSAFTAIEATDSPPDVDLLLEVASMPLMSLRDHGWNFDLISRGTVSSDAAQVLLAAEIVPLASLEEFAEFGTS